MADPRNDGASSQVDGPSDDKVTVEWTGARFERNTNFPSDERCRGLSTSLFTLRTYRVTPGDLSDRVSRLDVTIFPFRNWNPCTKFVSFPAISAIGVQGKSMLREMAWKKAKKEGKKKKKMDEKGKNHRGFRLTDAQLALISPRNKSRADGPNLFFH